MSGRKEFYEINKISKRSEYINNIPISGIEMLCENI